MSTYVGVVKTFGLSKGFGFIESAQIQGDVFFGTRDLPAELKDSILHPGFFELRGREVQFGVTSRDGRQVATNVALAVTENMPIVGTVKSYNDQKGFGFMGVSCLEGADAFFSKRDIPPNMHAVDGRSLVGKIASFNVILQADGKPQARNVKFYERGGKGDWGGQGDLIGTGSGRSLQDGQGAQGTVASYNAQRGFGFISCLLSPGVDLYFKSAEEIPVGSDLAFCVKMMPDGKPQARDLMAALVEGHSAVGTVIRYVPQTGYGFIRIPGQPNDVHFRKDVVPLELQGQELDGKTVRFTVTMHQGLPQASTAQFLARPPPGYVAPSMEQGGMKRSAAGAGGYNASKRPRGAAPFGAPAAAGAWQDFGQMAGRVVSFNASKGFGFIQSPVSTNGDVYFKALNLPVEHQQRSDLVGVQVSFQGSATPDGKLQANSVQVVV